MIQLLPSSDSVVPVLGGEHWPVLPGMGPGHTTLALVTLVTLNHAGSRDIAQHHVHNTLSLS